MNIWLPEEDEALRLAYGKMPTAELARLLERSATAVRKRARKLGLVDASRWTLDEDRVLRRRFATEPSAAIALDLGREVQSVATRARRLGLKKSQAYMRGAYREALRQHALTHPAVIASRFRKGAVPQNKGRPMSEWMSAASRARCRATQFQPGRQYGRAAQLYQPIGAERVTRDGYLERKTNDDLPLQRRWRAVHLLVWEAANGPLPRGHCVRFKDGMRTTIAAEITLDKLELVTRAENLRRNSVHNYPPELRSAIRAKASLTRVINNATRGERHV